MATTRSTLKRTIKHSNKAIHSLYEFFSLVEDPRKKQGRRHELAPILAMTVIGMLQGADSMAKLERVLNHAPLRKRMEREFGLKHGIPSHDTFSRAIAWIESGVLALLLEAWVTELIGEYEGHYAVDGKSVNASTRKNEEHSKPPYVLNSFSPQHKLVVSMRKIGDKTNEMPEMKHFLPTLHLNGSLITADAAHTHNHIMKQITDAGGHYFFCVKENRKLLRKELEFVFNEGRQKGIIRKHRFEVNRDRYETRDFEIAGVKDFWKIPERVAEAGFVTVGRVTRYTERLYTSGRIRSNSEEVMYYISDEELSADEFIDRCRCHWAIENTLHYVLDERFNEDRSTARRCNAVENLAALRRIAFNLYQIEQSGKNVRLDPEYFMVDCNSTMKLILQPQSCPKIN